MDLSWTDPVSSTSQKKRAEIKLSFSFRLQRCPPDECRAPSVIAVFTRPISLFVRCMCACKYVYQINIFHLVIVLVPPHTGISCCHRAYLQPGHRESLGACLPRQLRRNDGGRFWARHVRSPWCHTYMQMSLRSRFRWPWLAGFDRNFWPDCWLGCSVFDGVSTIEVWLDDAKSNRLVVFDEVAYQTFRNVFTM